MTELGWASNDQWGAARYSWAPFNVDYGTWYRLHCERKGLTSEVKVASGKGAVVLVQPDLEPGRWYWSVKVGLTKKTVEPVKWGSKPTRDEAMQAAREAFEGWGG